MPRREIEEKDGSAELFLFKLMIGEQDKCKRER